MNHEETARNSKHKPISSNINCKRNKTNRIYKIYKITFTEVLKYHDKCEHITIQKKNGSKRLNFKSL